MRILTFKRAVVIAAIGGVAYAHKQRGGVWTIDSISDTIKDTLRELWSSASNLLAPASTEARVPLTHAAEVARTRRARVSPARAHPPAA